jgi:hypothetical protein
MKIDPSPIIADHFKTLRDARSNRISLLDLVTFYFLPAVAAGTVFEYRVTFTSDVFGQSIAVFAIFSALLFSVQVALFGIFTKRRSDVDEYREAFEARRLAARRELIKETNSNISYLIFFSAFSVTVFIGAFAVRLTDKVEAPIAVFLYLHFMLTLLMIIKRVHALFDKEYDLDVV